jgi:hypothetical protein
MREEKKKEFDRLVKERKEEDPEEEISLGDIEEIQEDAKRNIEEKMQGQYGKDLEQKFRQRYALVAAAELAKKKDGVDGVADMLSKLAVSPAADIAVSMQLDSVLVNLHHGRSMWSQQRSGSYHKSRPSTNVSSAPVS